MIFHAPCFHGLFRVFRGVKRDKQENGEKSNEKWRTTNGSVSSVPASADTATQIRRERHHVLLLEEKRVKYRGIGAVELVAATVFRPSVQLWQALEFDDFSNILNVLYSALDPYSILDQSTIFL